MSLIQPYGYQSSSCGYCKDPETGERTKHSSASYYAGITNLTVDHYQILIDRGWRRSGSLMYKPDVRRSCCPHYTIRLHAVDFIPSRAQRKTLNRWNRFVLGEKYIEAANKRPKTKEEKARQKNDFDLLSTVHESEISSAETFASPEHRFEVALEPDTFTQEKYELFEQYQRLVHKERPNEITKTGFRRFLCASPLTRTKRDVNGKEQKLGSYHQTYRLDGRLIAFAVLDLLPHAVSAVYFIYDVEFERYTFGKLSALREAALAIEGQYEYYYMGYYVHTCVKMRYKNEYKPQYVLDPESHAWHPLDAEMTAKMDVKKYVSLAEELNPKHGEDVKMSDERMESPASAANSGLSIFDLKLCGITPLEELRRLVTLDEVLVLVRPGPNMQPIKVYTCHLQSWVDSEEDEFNDPYTLRGRVAELAATIGPVVAKATILDFS